MNRDIKKAAIEALRELSGTGPLDIDYCENGICICLVYLYDISDLYVQDIMKRALKWPSYSGNALFPVPHPKKTPNRGYMEESNVWKGEYGELRKELAAWLADELEKELES